MAVSVKFTELRIRSPESFLLRAVCRQFEAEAKSTYRQGCLELVVQADWKTRKPSRKRERTQPNVSAALMTISMEA
ncbi:hypothetical protein ACVWY2_008872 [Bradyrhizobium sp. JR6.1]